MRARYPDSEGCVERDGVRIFYEVYGDGDPTLFFMAPSWASHSRGWKAQIPYFARHHRVVVYDARGAGRSDRPEGAEAYTIGEFVADAAEVLKVTDSTRVVPVGSSASGPHALMLCLAEPDLVAGLCLMGPFFPVGGESPDWMTNDFNARREHYEGIERYNRHSISQDWRGFMEMWAQVCYPEPHSTRQREDAVRYAMEVDPQTSIASLDASGIAEAGSVAKLVEGPLTDAMIGIAKSIGCPAMIVCGDNDLIAPLPWSRALAELIPQARLEVFENTGHIPSGRYPVRFNILLREFVEEL